MSPEAARATVEHLPAAPSPLGRRHTGPGMDAARASAAPNPVAGGWAGPRSGRPPADPRRRAPQSSHVSSGRPAGNPLHGPLERCSRPEARSFRRRARGQRRRRSGRGAAQPRCCPPATTVRRSPARALRDTAPWSRSHRLRTSRRPSGAVAMASGARWAWSGTQFRSAPRASRRAAAVEIGLPGRWRRRAACLQRRHPAERRRVQRVHPGAARPPPRPSARGVYATGHGRARAAEAATVEPDAASGCRPVTRAAHGAAGVLRSQRPGMRVTPRTPAPWS